MPTLCRLRRCIRTIGLVSQPHQLGLWLRSGLETGAVMNVANSSDRAVVVFQYVFLAISKYIALQLKL